MEITNGKDLSFQTVYRGDTQETIPVRDKLNIDSVKAAIKKTGGNKSKAAKVLGVGRATLYRFLAKNRDIKNYADQF